MSAIAGLNSGRSCQDAEMLTRKLLQYQRIYGSDIVKLTRVGSATFGVSPQQSSDALGIFGPLALVADLRLDNRDELLERIGELPRNSSDVDLLLAAWLKVGETCLDWVAGDFALAVFDSRTRRLTLARDPTGQKPLHYAQHNDQVAFASMPVALRLFLDGLVVDRIGLAAAALGVRDDDPRTNFEQISRVLPGEVVRFAPSGPERKIYWDPQTAYDARVRDADLVEGYRHALDLAVASCLKGCSHPIATHLSSGYDSSSVTATAARLVTDPDKIIAFTSAPIAAAPVPQSQWRIGDESEIAAATAAKLGIRHVVVREAPPMRTVMRRQFLLSQDLNVCVPNIAWLLQIRRQAAASGATCLLSGECGNASLNAGGLYVLPEWLKQGRCLTWAKQAWKAAQRRDTRWRGVLFNSFEPWIPAPISATLQRYYHGASLADSSSFLRSEWIAKALASAPAAPKHRNSYEARIHLIRNGNPAMFRKAGQAGEGVDERDPLADRRLIEFSLKIPPEALYWNGVPRPLARAALADRVPQSVINLPVRGLQSADWAMRFTQRDAHEMLEEISASSAAQELLDFARMRRAISRWPTAEWNQSHVRGLYRGCLIGALSAGMFALVHEQGASPEYERL